MDTQVSKEGCFLLRQVPTVTWKQTPPEGSSEPRGTIPSSPGSPVGTTSFCTFSVDGFPALTLPEYGHSRARALLLR
jgi:hypothetical protein